VVVTLSFFHAQVSNVFHQRHLKMAGDSGQAKNRLCIQAAPPLA
jgi:hypothetical protein